MLLPVRWNLSDLAFLAGFLGTKASSVLGDDEISRLPTAASEQTVLPLFLGRNGF